jgi:hypothetical protein
MNRIRITNGPVAYFDILGYESINSSNEIEKVAQVIIDHLDGIPAAFVISGRTAFYLSA